MVRSDNLLDLLIHAAKIAVHHVGINVDDRLNVVMAYRSQLRATRNGRQIAEYLHGRATTSGGIGSDGGGCRSARSRAVSRNRNALKILQRIQLVLRSLDGNVVADTILWIEPKGR